MPLPNWGPLEKSQDDSEKIEEAINRLIAAHNDNPDAHTGEGQSLQSHKTSEIIDHAVKSIIADKIGEFEVLLSKITFDKFYYTNHWDDIGNWAQYGVGTITNGPGYLYLESGSGANGTKRILANNDLTPADFDKNPIFETELTANYDTNIISYFGVGSFWDAKMVGFKIQNNAVYGCWGGYGSEHTTLLSGVDPTELHTYRAVMTSGSKIEFYIDGVLKATATTNLPTGSTEEYLTEFYIEATGGATNRVLGISYVRIIQDK